MSFSYSPSGCTGGTATFGSYTSSGSNLSTGTTTGTDATATQSASITSTIIYASLSGSIGVTYAWSTASVDGVTTARTITTNNGPTSVTINTHTNCDGATATVSMTGS